MPSVMTKNEFDVQSSILNPSTKTSVTTAKGFDRDENTERTGYAPTGFDEINTSDLPSGVYNKDNILFINLMISFLDQQQILQQLYGIDVYPTYKMFLNELGTYCSTTKGTDGILLKNLTIKKQDIRQQFSDTQSKGKNVISKVMGSDQEQKESGW
jgi:hypothetical protein